MNKRYKNLFYVLLFLQAYQIMNYIPTSKHEVDILEGGYREEYLSGRVVYFCNQRGVIFEQRGYGKMFFVKSIDSDDSINVHFDWLK